MWIFGYFQGQQEARVTEILGARRGWGSGDRRRVVAGGRSPGYDLVFNAAFTKLYKPA